MKTNKYTKACKKILKEWPKSYSNGRKYIKEEVYFKSNENSYLPLLSCLPSLNNGMFFFHPYDNIHALQ